MPRLLSSATLARTSARHPWRVILLWLLILALALVAARDLDGALSTSASFTNDPDSAIGAALIEERLGGPEPFTESVIVRSDALTVSDPAFTARVAAVSQALLAMPKLVAAAPTVSQLEAADDPQAARLVSTDRHATIIPVTLRGNYQAIHAQMGDYLRRLDAFNRDGFTVLTVGTASLTTAFTRIAEQDLRTAELVGIPAAVVILVVVFGALVAVGIPLLLSLISIGIALGQTALIGRSMDLSVYVVNMISMIGLAVGIDYALFIIARYREERRHGYPKEEAISITGATASKAILFSGITVVLALSGLFLLPTTIFRSLGAGAVLVVIVAVAAMLTLVPALIGLLGDRLDWPRHPRYPNRPGTPSGEASHADRQGFWGQVTSLVTDHPIVALVLTSSLLVAAAIPAFDLHRGATGVDSLPPSDAKTAYDILNRDFSAEFLSPVQIVIDAPKTPQSEAAIGQLVRELQRHPSFDSTPQLSWNDAGDLAVVRFPLAADPSSPEAYAALDELRDDVIPRAFGKTGTPVYVTGTTALNADFFELVDIWTPVVFAFVLGLSFLLLLIAFRSVIVPLKAIVMNLLSVGAAYGLMVLIFERGYGTRLIGVQQSPTIEAWVPIFLYCILFGLSMDYQVFLLSRIREHFDHTHHNRESVAVGLQATGRLITGAALIMVVVFSAFVSGRLVVFQQLGFGLAIAIAIDATLVRSILVPAAMALLGDLNWYLPKWLQWLPDLRIEGQSTMQPEPSPPDALGLDHRD